MKKKSMAEKCFWKEFMSDKTKLKKFYIKSTDILIGKYILDHNQKRKATKPWVL